MSNARGFAALDAMIAQLRSLETLPEDCAKEVAKEAKNEIAKQVSEQDGPDGRPWIASKSGAPVLVNAASKIRSVAVESTVVLTITGVDARHHLGAVKGGRRRQILPTNSLPDNLTRAIAKVVKKEFLSKMKKG